MSLKRRIVGWYTLWTLFLMLIIFIMFFIYADSVSARNIRHEIEEVLSDVADDVRYVDGRLSFRDLDEVDDGIYVFVLREDGTRLFGREVPEILSTPYQEGQRVLNFASEVWAVSDMLLSDGVYIRTAARLSNIYAILTSDYLPLLIIAPVLVLISALGGYFIVRRAFSPLDRLIDTAQGIAGGSDLDKRLESGNTEEGRALSDAFNSMLSRLDTAFKREKEFTDDASHELRTPVAIIKAESEYALSVLDERNEVEESLNTINRESDRMTRLLTSLLDISRSDKGTIKVNKRRFSISDLLTSVCEGMEELAEEKKISFSYTVNDGLYVEADDDMITRAVINLVDNAFTYSKKNGSVELSLHAEDKRAVIRIKDDGIGISKEDQGRIFDRFFQVDKSRSSSSSGLGLAMVKEIACLNNADVNVESILGIGSLFTLSLPLI